MVSSQARVAASGSVIPAGVATGVGEAVVLAVAAEVCCAGKGMEETTRTTLKKARRRIIRELLKDYRRDWKPVPHRVVALASGRASKAVLQLRDRTPKAGTELNRHRNFAKRLGMRRSSGALN